MNPPFSAKATNEFSLGGWSTNPENDNVSDALVWNFTPDQFSPVIGLFYADGELLKIDDTGFLSHKTADSGTYYVGISRNSSFEPTSDEDRFYTRPYELEITVPRDLSVEDISLDTTIGGIRVKYTAWNIRSDNHLFEAFWATGPSAGEIIADAQIDAWRPRANEASRFIDLRQLANAPAEATHIVVIADREDQFTEVKYSNNVRHIALIQDPTIEVIIGDGGSWSYPNSGPSYMKEEWSVWVQVTNNSLIPHTFQLSQEYVYAGVYLKDGKTALDWEDGFYLGLHPPGFSHMPVGLEPEITLDALATSNIERSSFALTNWEWLPTDSKLVVPHVFDHAMEPITDAIGLFQTFNGAKLDAIEQLIKLEADDAVRSVLKGLAEYTEILNTIGTLYTLYDAFSSDILQYAYVAFDINTSVTRDGHVLPISVVSTERVEPRSSRKWYLALARGEIALAKLAFGEALPTLVKSPLAGLVLVSVAAGSVELARYNYEQAQDPPDPEYTSRVLVPEVETTDLADISDDRLRAWFEAQRSRISLNTAAYLAQNKADGAALAGDSEWQALQLIDSAAFDREATFVAGRSISLANLVLPLLSETDRSPAEVLAQLQSQGLPKDTQELLVGAGWSEADIETMLASLTEEQVAAPNPLAEGIRSNAIATAIAVVDKLRQVTEIRSQEVNAGTAISAADMDALTDMRNRIDVGLVNGASAVELMGLTENYIRRTTELIVETNNWDSLQFDLEFGYLALLMVQEGLRPDAIAETINGLEAAGAKAEHVTYLRDEYDIVQDFAKYGDWTQMTTVLEGMATYVLEHWGHDLSNSEAYRLFGQLMTERSVALGDDLSSAPEPTSDSESFVALAGLPESLTPISMLDGADLVYHGISATWGTVAVDQDGTVPRIRYTSKADASGRERLTYMVIDSDTWRFQAVHADGEVVPALRWGDESNQGKVTSENTAQFVFIAERGAGLVLKQMAGGFPLRVRIVSADDGEVVAEGDVPWDRSFTIPSDGTFLLEVSTYNQNPTEFELEARMVRTEFEPLETGYAQTGLIPSGEQVAFSISVEAPDVLYYDALGSGGWRATTLSVLSPTGTLFSGNDFYDSGLLWADDAGEYVFIIRNHEPEEVEYNFRVLARSNATPLLLDENLTTQILAPKGTRLFVLENTSAGVVVLEDLGSTPHKGQWKIPRRGDVGFGGALGFGLGGVAIIDSRDAALVVIESHSMDPVDVRLMVRALAPPDRSVAKDETVQLTLPFGSVAQVAFDAQRDEVLLFNSLVPAEVYLERPDGETQRLGDRSAFRVAVTGQHRLIFMGNDWLQTIEFRVVSLSISQEITATTGMWQREFVDSEEIHAYQFVATEEMPVQLHIQSPFAVYWVVYSASGEYVDSGYRDSASDTNVFDVRVSDPGKFFLTVGTWAGAESSYEIQLLGLAGGNHAPVAQDGTVAATEDGGPAAGQLVADDIDSDDTPATLFYSLMSGPGEGSVSVSSDGSFVFDPGIDFQDLAAGEARDVTFTFQATDSHGEVSNFASVVVTVIGVNDAPVARNGTAVATENGGPAAGQLLADDVDSDDTPATLIYSLVSEPGEGSVSVSPDGSFMFDPGSDFQDLAAGETRDVTFTFQATDSHGEVSNLASVVVTVTGVDEDVTLPEDVTDRIATDFYGRQYNRRTGVYGFYASITNNADTSLVYPIRLLLTELGPAGTAVKNAHGTLEDGTPYFDFTGTAALASGETTEAVVIAVKPAPRTRYTLTPQVLAVVTEGDGLEGESVANLNSFSGESANAFPIPSFQNPSNRYDVNADGFVTARDALTVINHLSRGADLIADDLAAAIGMTPSLLVDVNNDGNASPLDALLIINELSRRSRADRVSVAEGEFVELRTTAPRYQSGLKRSIWERERLFDAEYAKLAQDSVEPLAAEFVEQVASLIVRKVNGDADEEEPSRAPDESVEFALEAGLSWLD